MSLKRFALLSILTLLASFGGGYLLFHSYSDGYSYISVLDQPRKVTALEVVSTADGPQVESFANGWDLVVFGYVDCPDICPKSLGIYKDVALKQLIHNLRLVFISTDEGKSVDELAAYIHFFHKDIVGIKGDKASLQQLAGDFLTSFGEEKGGKLWHSPKFYLVDPQGNFTAYIKPESLESGEWLAEVKAFIESYEPPSEDMGLTATDGWIRAMPPVSRVTAAYLKIQNDDKLEKVIISGSGDIAKSLEFHISKVEDGSASMEEVDHFTIPAGGRLELKEGGYHIMLRGLKRPLKVGELIPLRFTFADGMVRTVEFKVK